MSDIATAEESQVLPVVAVVGRPNVGKSTLVNRMIGRREAVVQDVPGVTRDRVSYDATWNGRQFVLVDTGGWAPDAKGMAAQVTEQAELAVAAADAVVFVVDATVGTQDVDEAVVKVLRRSGKPVILAANKVDDQRTEAEAAAMWQLGLGEPFPVSALHGRGSGDLLDLANELAFEFLPSRATLRYSSASANSNSSRKAVPSASGTCSAVRPTTSKSPSSTTATSPAAASTATRGTTPSSVFDSPASRSPTFRSALKTSPTKSAAGSAFQTSISKATSAFSKQYLLRRARRPGDSRLIRRRCAQLF